MPLFLWVEIVVYDCIINSQGISGVKNCTLFVLYTSAWLVGVFDPDYFLYNFRFVSFINKSSFPHLLYASLRVKRLWGIRGGILLVKSLHLLTFGIEGSSTHPPEFMVIDFGFLSFNTALLFLIFIEELSNGRWPLFGLFLLFSFFGELLF